MDYELEMEMPTLPREGDCISALYESRRCNAHSLRRLGVMPVGDTSRAKCKCGFKLIHYMAYGTKMVAV